MGDVRKQIAAATVFCVAFGLLAGGLAMYVAWQHNPQCTIHCDGNIEWRYWLFVGFTWFMTVSVVLFLVALIFIYIARATTRLFNGKNT